MPVHVAVNRERKLVVTSYTGEVNDGDVARQIFEIKTNAPYDSEYSAITDFTGVTQFNISLDQIRNVAETESPLAGSKRVMVAPSDVAYGTSRMFQALASNTRPNITVVRTLAEAYQVLGISPK